MEPEIPSRPTIEVARAEYPGRKAAVEQSRIALRARYDAAVQGDARTQIIAEARQILLDGITRELLPAWYGTPWDFYGTSEVPGEGVIACGYLVSTTLRDAGFRVQRFRLAQQAAEQIVETLAAESEVKRFRAGDVDAVVRAVQEWGVGLYVVGLDHHVGFLWNDGAVVQFCHSNYLGDAVVMCEDARDSFAMQSGYHVVGNVLADRTIVRWLEAEAIPTVMTP